MLNEHLLPNQVIDSRNQEQRVAVCAAVDRLGQRL